MKLDLNTIINGACIIAEGAGAVYLLKKSWDFATNADRVEKAIGKVSRMTDVEIEDSIIEQAVKKAVEAKADDLVKKSEKSMNEQIGSQVKKVIDARTKEVSDRVTSKLNHMVDSMGIQELKNQVLKNASKHIRERLDSDMDDILSDYKERLKLVAKTAKTVWDD